jgi:hypothetical protein
MEFCRSVSVILGLSAVLWGSFAYAQCTKDTDCKGDRVCSAGACVDPLPAAPVNPTGFIAPSSPQVPGAFGPSFGPPLAVPGTPFPPNVATAPPEPAESRWFSGYANVAGLASLHSWLGDSKENAGYGVYAAGYWAPNPLFHLGAFFHFYEAHGVHENTAYWDSNFTYENQTSDTPHLGAGASLKIGWRSSDRIWLGGAMDLGVHLAFGNDHKVGVHCFPRFEIDGQVAQSGRFRLALFGSFGPLLAPGIGDYVNGGVASLVALQMLAGVMVGG